MSKIIDSLTQASIDSKNYTGVVLARLHFDTAYRFANTYQNIYWDEVPQEGEAGVGEVEYVGLGDLADLSAMGETGELQAQNITLTLSGIKTQYIADVFSNDYSGNPIYIWYGTLDRDTLAVEGGQNGPVLIFAGRLDYSNIEFGDTAKIVVHATSRLADWERPRGGRYNHEHQTRHVDATDLGFRYVKGLQNREIVWGGTANPLFGRNSPENSPGGGADDTRIPR